MPDDARTVPVTLDLDPETAAALQDPATRAHVERLIRQTVRSTAAPDEAVAVDQLVERFRTFAAQHTLGDLDLKALISEGRR